MKQPVNSTQKQQFPARNNNKYPHGSCPSRLLRAKNQTDWGNESRSQLPTGRSNRTKTRPFHPHHFGPVHRRQLRHRPRLSRFLEGFCGRNSPLYLTRCNVVGAFRGQALVSDKSGEEELSTDEETTGGRDRRYILIRRIALKSRQPSIIPP